MSKLNLTHADLATIGYPPGRPTSVALNIMHKNYKRADRQVVLQLLTDLFNNPYNYVEDEILQKIANELIVEENTIKEIPLKLQADEFRVFGQEFIEDGAMQQMKTAMRLPISMGGSLMPDAHQGYGLPIGGVLATNNAVIPFGVGVDIGCRMCLTIYDVPAVYLKGHLAKFKQMLMEHTRFGINCSFEKPIDDEIFEQPLFNEMPLLRQLKDRAYRQIGTSGSGNHFVEFGEITIQDTNNEWNLETTKTYIGILSHSGSRGLGATIAQTYTKIAMEKCPLPNEAKHLAWLDLDTQAGQEYWLAMNLAGDYASACHHQIHRRLAKALGAKPLAIIENHHNFAWKEQLSNGTEVIVHRKGATPAGKGVLGIIPGSMATPGFIVRGKGFTDSLNSASHGAGRVLSRTKAKQSITNKELKQRLLHAGVTLLGGGLDEAPMAYKDINKVMAQQTDLVTVVGTFNPKIVRMATDDKSED